MILPIILFLILLIAPDVYLWLHLVEPLKTWWISTIWFVPTALSLLSFFMARAGFYHNTFMRIMFAFILIFALPKIIFILLDFFVMWQIALGAALMVDLISLYGFFFGWRRIIVRETVCESNLLPDSFNGYRILQFSDLHVGTYIQNPKSIKKLVRIMNEQQADLVVFTGDLVNIHAEEVLPFMSDLRTIKAKDGVFSIMGNHDYCEYGMDAAHEKKQKETEPIKESTAHRHQRILEYLEERMGWKMLMNEHVTIVRKNNAKEENKEEKNRLDRSRKHRKTTLQKHGKSAESNERIGGRNIQNIAQPRPNPLATRRFIQDGYCINPLGTHPRRATAHRKVLACKMGIQRMGRKIHGKRQHAAHFTRHWRHRSIPYWSLA